MAKAHLIILERINKTPTIGGCSVCPEFMFQVGEFIGKAEDHERKMQDFFDAHFREVHLREDTSRAAAKP